MNLKNAENVMQVEKNCSNSEIRVISR